VALNQSALPTREGGYLRSSENSAECRITGHAPPRIENDSGACLASPPRRNGPFLVRSPRLSALSGYCQLPKKWTLPKLKIPPSAATNQYPAPSDAEVIPTTG
jgi:hypothetical protein